MTWMVFSLGNGVCWHGSFELYLRIEDLLCTLNAGLRQIHSFAGEFFGYYLMTEQYAEEVRRTITAALDSRELDEEVLYHLVALSAVYRGGKIIMG